jgi:hypothetical protein
METAETVILDALKEIVAIPAEAAVDAYKAQAGIFYLNLMMFELSAVGVNLGYTTVNSLGDLITVDDGAIEGIVKNLAIEISPLFKGTLTSPDLFEQAQSSLETLRQIAYESSANSPLSSNLPIGSGNEYWNTALTIKKPQYLQKTAATLPQSQYES